MIYFLEDYRKIPLKIAEYSFSLSPNEKERLLKRKKFEQSIYARYVASYGIQEEFHLSKREFKFSIKGNGQPIIIPDIANISLSHSGYSVIAAISNEPIGVDIEKITNIRPKICERYFSKSEKSFIQSSNDENTAFTTIWCLKESIGKLTELGLSGVISTTDFHFDNNIISSPNYTGFFNVKILNNTVIAYASPIDLGEDYLYRL